MSTWDYVERLPFCCSEQEILPPIWQGCRSLGQTTNPQGYEKAKISIAFLFAGNSEISSWTELNDSLRGKLPTDNP